MFAPQGFVPFSMLIPYFDEAEDIFFGCNEVVNFAWSQRADFEIEEEFREDYWQLANMLCSPGEMNRYAAYANAFRTWVIGSYLLTTPVFACSANGSVVRVDNRLFDDDLGISRSHWRHRYDPGSRIHKIVYDELYRSEPEGPNQLESFPFLDIETGMIESSSFINQLDQYPNRLRSFITVATELSGRSVCFLESDAPRDVQGLLESCRVDFLFPNGDDDHFSADYDHIYEAMLQAYPNGKSDSWTAVEKKVGYSRRSMERAMRKADPSRTWAEGWAGTGQ